MKYKYLVKQTHTFRGMLLGAALTILFVLTAISGILLLSRLIEYMMIDDTEIRLVSNVDTEFNLFSAQYENGAGEITVLGSDEQFLIAPGTGDECIIRFRNTDTTALDYELSVDAAYTSEYEIPILFRILDSEGNYLLGDKNKWVEVEDITGVVANKTLGKRRSTEYKVQWKWAFDSGNGEYDTFLGANASDEDIGVSVSMSVCAWENTDAGTSDDLRKKDIRDMIISGIALLAFGLAIPIIAVYRSKKEKGYYI